MSQQPKEEEHDDEKDDTRVDERTDSPLPVTTAPMTKADQPTPEGQSCFTCAAFHYCDPEDVEGCDGYCCNPQAPGSDAEYGGHWAMRTAWCNAWIEAPSDELAERVAMRAKVMP